MASEKAHLRERARINRERAERCRELIRAIQNEESIAMLEEFARELEATAARLELEAGGAVALAPKKAAASGNTPS